MSLEDLKEIPYGKTAIELKNISLAFGGVKALTAVSYTHLTLPTICSV